MDELFGQLRGLLVPYAKHFKIHADTGALYALQDVAKPVAMFGVANKQPREVRLIFYPLIAFPELKRLIPASLLPRLRMRSVFKLQAVTPGELAALKQLIAAAWKRVAAQRKLDPKRSFAAKQLAPKPWRKPAPPARGTRRR